MPYRFESIYLDDPIVPGRVLDIFEPKEATRDIALYLVHGGGWRGGARGNLHALAQACRNEGFLCAMPDYRLSGSTILDEIMDVRHGYDLFQTWLKEHGRSPRVAVYGSSAGAHLGALLSLAAPGDCGEPLTFGDCAYQQPWTQPVGVALQATPTTFEPWDDIFPHGWASMQGIVGPSYDEDPDAYRRVSPIEHVKADSCPVFLLEADNEHMFPAEINARFIEKMESLGRRVETKTYTNTEHGFLYDVTRRQQKEALNDILAFVATL